MATHTWKIGEYARGGIITVNTTKTSVTVIGKEWDFSTGSRRSSDQSGAKEFTRTTVEIADRNAFMTLNNALNDLTTSYYAGKVMEWIKSKTKLDTFYGGIHW